MSLMLRVCSACVVWSVQRSFSVAAPANEHEDSCVDQDDRWAAHNSDCGKMQRLCNDASFGSLVRKWCPRSCGLCGGEASEEPPPPVAPILDVKNPLVSMETDVVVEQFEAHPSNQHQSSENRSFQEAVTAKHSVPVNLTGQPMANHGRSLKDRFHSPYSNTSAASWKGNSSNDTCLESDDPLTVENTSEAILYRFDFAEGMLEKTSVALPGEALHIGGDGYSQGMPLALLEAERNFTSNDVAAGLSRLIGSSEISRSAEDAEPVFTWKRNQKKVSDWKGPLAIQSPGILPVEGSKEDVLWKAGDRHLAWDNSTNSSTDDDALLPRIHHLHNVTSPPPKVIPAIAERPQEERDCPLGYERLHGEVYGADQFGGTKNAFAGSIKECGNRCDRTPGCGSFEYSPTRKKCYRNSQTHPTHDEDRGDWMFCRRRPCPSFKTKEACVGPLVTSSFHSIDVDLRPGSYCIWSGGVCQAPMACTAEDCFLPDGGLPGMELPRWQTLWMSRLGLEATMKPTSSMAR